jgi:hypothetical protein
MAATVYAGRFESAMGGYVCPLCAGQRMHSPVEHRQLVAAIRHKLQPEVWGDDDHEIVSRGHHPPDRFLAAAQEDADVAWALDLTDTDPAELHVAHTWRRYVPRSRWDEGERVGAWWETNGPGPGACPFTVAALP